MIMRTVEKQSTMFLTDEIASYLQEWYDKDLEHEIGVEFMIMIVGDYIPLSINNRGYLEDIRVFIEIDDEDYEITDILDDEQLDIFSSMYEV